MALLIRIILVCALLRPIGGIVECAAPCEGQPVAPCCCQDEAACPCCLKPVEHRAPAPKTAEGEPVFAMLPSPERLVAFELTRVWPGVEARRVGGQSTVPIRIHACVWLT